MMHLIPLIHIGISVLTVSEAKGFTAWLQASTALIF